MVDKMLGEVGLLAPSMVAFSCHPSALGASSEARFKKMLTYGNLAKNIVTFLSLGLCEL